MSNDHDNRRKSRVFPDWYKNVLKKKGVRMPGIQEPKTKTIFTGKQK